MRAMNTSAWTILQSRRTSLPIAQKEGTLYRNFQGYSTKAGADLYAFGMSAISQFENIYAQNHKDFKEYYARIDAGRPATHVGYRMTERRSHSQRNDHAADVRSRDR